MFMNHVDLQVTGVGTPKITQKREFKLSGKFMGKGKTSIDGTFRPEVEYPDFDVKIKIEKTDMTTLNEAFKALAGFDVRSGNFSLISELHADEGRVQGYIKPFLKSRKFMICKKKKQTISFNNYMRVLWVRLLLYWKMYQVARWLRKPLSPEI